MTIAEIKQAVDDGKKVIWSNTGYEVIKDSKGQYLICFKQNNYCIGLTNQAGNELNGQENEFSIVPQCGYLGYYSDKKAEFWADTSYEAQQKAVAYFKPPKSKKHLVSVQLCIRKDAAEVIHTADF